MNSPDDLSAFLRSRLTAETSLADIADLMAPLAINSFWVPLGGSGARQEIFRLPENLRALYQFDGDDRLVAYAAYRRPDDWPAGQSETTVVPDVPLTLVRPTRQG